MTDTDLIEFTTSFRDGILDSDASDGMCAAVCWPLAPLLSLHGTKCECVESDLAATNHIWIKLADGRALDPTADQFGEQYPPVYLGPLLDIHRNAT